MEEGDEDVGRRRNREICLDECLYYLVREMGGGLRADEQYFDGALRLIEPSRPLICLEIDALVRAAKMRGRLAELDVVMERYFAGQAGQVKTVQMTFEEVAS